VQKLGRDPSGRPAPRIPRKNLAEFLQRPTGLGLDGDQCYVVGAGLSAGPRGLHPMGEFIFEPIGVNASAPGGECVLRTFDDVGAFILIQVEVSRRKLPHWQAVRQDLAQARFGARRAETHSAMRKALANEGWLVK
jgi:hypothetical protein